MKILKKNGKVEEYNKEKISTALMSAAQDISFMISDSDLNLLINEVTEIISNTHKDNSCSSTYEIRGAIYHVLLEEKFVALCKSYMNL